MRKLHVVAVAAIALAMVAAPAGAKGKKVEEAEYQHAAGISVLAPTGESGMAFTCVEDTGGCLTFQVPTGATAVSVEAVDETGNDVLMVVGGRDEGEFCGATDKPVALDPEFDTLYVTILTGTCPNGSVSLPTTGTVSVTFS